MANNENCTSCHDAPKIPATDVPKFLANVNKNKAMTELFAGTGPVPEAGMAKLSKAEVEALRAYYQLALKGAAPKK